MTIFDATEEAWVRIMICVQFHFPNEDASAIISEVISALRPSNGWAEKPLLSGRGCVIQVHVVDDWRILWAVIDREYIILSDVEHWIFGNGSLAVLFESHDCNRPWFCCRRRSCVALINRPAHENIWLASSVVFVQYGAWEAKEISLFVHPEDRVWARFIGANEHAASIIGNCSIDRVAHSCTDLPHGYVDDAIICVKQARVFHFVLGDPTVTNCILHNISLVAAIDRANGEKPLNIVAAMMRGDDSHRWSIWADRHRSDCVHLRSRRLVETAPFDPTCQQISSHNPGLCLASSREHHV